MLLCRTLDDTVASTKAAASRGSTKARFPILCNDQGSQNTSILGIGLRFEVRIEVEVVFANRSPNRSDFFDARFSLSTAFLEASEDSIVCSLISSFYRYLILGSNRRERSTFGSITVFGPSRSIL